MTERTHVIFNNIKYMFKQIKKARELQGEFSQNNDEFDIIQIILTVIFSIALVGIWYYGMKADKKIESGEKTNNPIINDLQAGNKLNEAINNYGGFEPKNIEENELIY